MGYEKKWQIPLPGPGIDLPVQNPSAPSFSILVMRSPLVQTVKLQSTEPPLAWGWGTMLRRVSKDYPQGTCRWVGASGFFVFAKIWNFLCLRFWNCSLAKSNSEHVWVRTYWITDSPGTGATSDASLDPQSFGQGLVHSWLKLWLKYRHNGYAYFFSPIAIQFESLCWVFSKCKVWLSKLTRCQDTASPSQTYHLIPLKYTF